MSILCNRRPVSCDDSILESMKLAQMANDQRRVHRNYDQTNVLMKINSICMTIEKHNKNNN